MEWLARFVEHYRQPISKISADTYREGLADLNAAQLDAACRKALRDSEFMPTVATIRKALREIENTEVDYVKTHVDYEPVSPEERMLTEEEQQRLNELKARIFNVDGDAKKPRPITQQKEELRKRGYIQ